MKQTAPEPGFVPAYRFFVVVRVLFWIAVGPVLLLLQLAGDPSMTADPAAGERLISALSLPNVAPLLLTELVLLGILFWPQGPARLGRWFVPLTLLIGLLPLLVGYYLWPASNPLQSPFVMFFFVTAVLIAWEYKTRFLYLYVLGLTFFQLVVSPRSPGIPWAVPTGFQVLQAVMLLLAGYVTATLATVQAEQRDALAEAYARQAAANERLQQHAATLEELAITRERNRLARELHDTLAHSLSAVTVQLEAVSSLWSPQPEKAQHILDQASETARTGLAEARRALQALRASPLEELGLVLALRELAEGAAQRAGAQLTLDVPDSLPPCASRLVEQGIYRIAQETLENVVRHAGAASIGVSLSAEQRRIVLSIEDDGQGLDPAQLPGAGEPNGRLGILGMRERASLIGGELEIHSDPGQGTRVILAVTVEGNHDHPCADL